MKMIPFFKSLKTGWIYKLICFQRFDLYMSQVKYQKWFDFIVKSCFQSNKIVRKIIKKLFWKSPGGVMRTFSLVNLVGSSFQKISPLKTYLRFLSLFLSVLNVRLTFSFSILISDSVSVSYLISYSFFVVSNSLFLSLFFWFNIFSSFFHLQDLWSDDYISLLTAQFSSHETIVLMQVVNLIFQPK